MKPPASYLTAVAFLLVSAACETSLAERDDLNTDGTWVGTTSQAASGSPGHVSAPGFFSLTVDGNKVTQVTFTVSHGDSCGGMFGVVVDVDQGIRADRSFEFSAPPGTPPFTVTGAFVSSDLAAGSLTAANTGIVCTSASTVRWTAVRQDPGS